MLRRKAGVDFDADCESLPAAGRSTIPALDARRRNTRRETSEAQLTTLYINHESLKKIATSLSEAGGALDSAGDSAPSSVDGGTGTPAILGILAKLVDNTGQLVVGVDAVGAAIASANSRYLGDDEQAAEAIEDVMETE
jgi:hypothetical protein